MTATLIERRKIERRMPRALVRTHTGTKSRILLPVAAIEHPRNFTVCMLGYYWAVDNGQIIIHKWFDNALKAHYMVQANLHVESMQSICTANGLLPHDFIFLDAAFIDPQYVIDAL